MSRTATLVLAAVVLCILQTYASAQEFLPKHILFKGAPEYSEDELLAASGIKKGVTLSFEKMKGHFDKLFATGVFESIYYQFDGEDLIFSLKPAVTLYSIRLENLPVMPGKELDAKLHERFPLYHGKVPSEGGMLESVRGVLDEILAAQGIKTSLTVTPYTDMKLRQVTAMSFSIVKPPVEIGEIHVASGTPALNSAAQQILTEQTGSPYSIEGSSDQIVTNLGNYYRDNGYLEADIRATAQLPATVQEGVIGIPFTVSILPGIQYKLSDIQLAPGLLVTSADIDRQTNLHRGGIIDGVLLRHNWELISRAYHAKGYLKAEVHPAPSFDREHGTAYFTVTVDPGPVYTMGTLRIDGVSDELRTQMLAAWKLHAGAIMNENEILNFFAIGDSNPTLKRLFAAVICNYLLTLNDNTHTADVVLRLEKRH